MELGLAPTEPTLACVERTNSRPQALCCPVPPLSVIHSLECVSTMVGILRYVKLSLPWGTLEDVVHVGVCGSVQHVPVSLPRMVLGGLKRERARNKPA